ncbi:MAG: type I-B CRISPR-associated protein Cas7/Cst2/DevR [Chloroflexi bacterium AL-W]|nr:type I-B CRISPR-associated protein Cas7/Cst2/DevR [Chloroflexi bacterium AL-N1]NOK68495.1 type I-B CRISPR-associated protein Cas7/Cst2/DevR [Chloroflexi bacterium AL-N10]NOK74141.1 type I-B CRISPR-associated protein Cas7/Cst2/DevR [Chloroflexi bacterium AL-N5]NOK83108.1 type I-B CRISPR-associated protein Cas7/Cst2/DevR [Chloroflexi bacterium AL-W]NOK90631.1 type I-B CRISPR-associated protein Cas7/Cst2/DevR [Chloroflexi bacterium AL-N15]
MAFVTGTFLIDAPASALNNMGNIPGEREDNTVGVKQIRAKDGIYPYVSAQAFRYWLRTTLADRSEAWQVSPIHRAEKIAFTDANPLEFWDDDLFGYMRAPSKKEARAKEQAGDVVATETLATVTRLSPFRVSTLVAIAPQQLTSDFGTMSRHEGNPVPHEHQFYRTALKGLFSLDLHACGTFSYADRTGFRHLDDVRRQKADTMGLQHMSEEKSYRLTLDQRLARIQALFDGLAHLEGGAKQTLHYTDVAPVLAVIAVTKGGNHMFGHILGATRSGQPECKIEALQEALMVFRDDLLSPVYVGWVRGYLDEERTKFEAFVSEYNVDTPYPIHISHPRTAFLTLSEQFAKNPGWLD